MKNLGHFLFTLFLLPMALFSQTATAPAGTGTIGDPYVITSVDNLYWITQNTAEWGKSFIQANAIDASSTSTWNLGEGWSPVGNASTSFTGSYDGQGYSITGITINSTDPTRGFFGQTNGATISNLRLISMSIVAGNYYEIGGMVGYANGGSFTNCSTTGSISNASDRVGGFAGAAGSGTTFNSSYSACTVTGTVDGNRIGGFIGWPASVSVTDCYASGAVSSLGAAPIVGGFVGYNGGTLVNCYSSGSVTASGANVGGFAGNNGGTATDCFWDTEASTQATSAAGTGKTTVQMQTQATFTNWDFTAGTGVWEIVAGFYPRLRTNPDEALPVELTTFTATQKNGVVLKWSTATETNNYGFDIERSANNVWQKIGFVAGSGTTNSPMTYSYYDNNAASGKSVYRLKQIDRDGRFEYSKEVEVNIETSANTFSLDQNYPNPFNPTTNISFSVPVTGKTVLTVFNMLGQEVASIFNGVAEAGKIHQAQFNASGLASGVYMYTIQSGSYNSVRKMTLVR